MVQLSWNLDVHLLWILFSLFFNKSFKLYFFAYSTINPSKNSTTSIFSANILSRFAAHCNTRIILCVRHTHFRKFYVCVVFRTLCWAVTQKFTRNQKHPLTKFKNFVSPSKASTFLDLHILKKHTFAWFGFGLWLFDGESEFEFFMLHMYF